MSHALVPSLLQSDTPPVPYLLGALVEHLAGARELVRVRRLPPQGGGVRRPRAGRLPGGRFGHVVGQAGTAGAGHGRGAAGGADKSKVKGGRRRLRTQSVSRSSVQLKGGRELHPPSCQ